MDSASDHYAGGRRHGLAGRGGFFRGSVRAVGRDAEVMRTRSPDLADVIARFLNGETIPRRDVDDPSPLRRYSTGRDARNSLRTHLYCAESTVQHPSAFGDGIVASCDDADLAQRVAAMLNDVDPAYRRKPRRGFGWW